MDRHYNNQSELKCALTLLHLGWPPLVGLTSTKTILQDDGSGHQAPSAVVVVCVEVDWPAMVSTCRQHKQKQLANASLMQTQKTNQSYAHYYHYHHHHHHNNHYHYHTIFADSTPVITNTIVEWWFRPPWLEDWTARATNILLPQWSNALEAPS